MSQTQEYMYKKYNHDNVVVIGIDADLSGGAKGSGLAIKRGVELAVDKINMQGGLLGKKVIVVAKDHQGISTQANANIDEFIQDSNTIAVIGGKHSAIIDSYMKKIQNNQLLFFSPWAAAASVTENGYKENYVFRVSLNDSFASKFLAQSALKIKKNPLVVVENSIWGKGALKNINLYFKENHMQEQDGIVISRGESKFEEALELLGKQKHDSIIMVLNAQESIKFVQQMCKLHINVPIISHWGMVGDAFFEETKECLKDMTFEFIQTFSLSKDHNIQAKELEKMYSKTYLKTLNQEINAVTGVVQAYDSVMLLATAVKQSNSLEREKNKNALENLVPYDGIVKIYNKPFDKINHDALNIKNLFMAKFDENGLIIHVSE
jgi:branched-chain amino acid transport system substrate-binding protein